jgi:TonB-linked SusC/RagA family outer membrane protein
MHPIQVGPPRTAAAIGLFCLALPGLLAAQQGRLTGKITDKETGKPLEAAQVLVVGTTLLVTSNTDGNYTFRDIAPGHYQVRVIRISYKAQLDSITVGPGETAALNFALTAAPIQLDEVVSTATGQQRKLEVGNVVAKIDAASVTKEAPITEIGNILSGRVAGVQVLKSGGTTGTGTRIRIRGANSLSLSNEPLYYIDGIRTESSSSGLSLDIGGGIGGGSTSRINDLNPDDIESIEIVKGPAAATLYGIQASNGVVRITTKKGVSGKAKWNVSTEAGQVADHNTYLQNYFPNFTISPTASQDYLDNGFTCTLQDQFNGNCTINSLTKYSPLTNPATRPLKPGFRQQQNLSVSGGTDQANYFLAAGYETEDGVFRLPAQEEDSVRRANNGAIPKTQIRPNALSKLSVRANLGANVSKTADVQASLAYVTSSTRLVENDNSFLTITGSAEASANTPDVMGGWFFTPAQLFAELAQQDIGRFTGGLTTNWRPRTWLTTRATFGYDATAQNDEQFFPTGQVAPYQQDTLGQLQLNRADVSQTSIDLASTATYKISPSLGGKTSVGAQWFRNLLRGTLVKGGPGLAPGQENLNGVTISGRDTSFESRTAGAFVEEELNYKERLFVTGAVRLDGASSFGKSFSDAVYPKTSVSWLTSSEPFWHLPWLNTFRLRAALGASGQLPRSTDAIKSYAGVLGKKDGIGSSGVLISNSGNDNLKPERSTEFEAGFDAGLAHDKVTVELTFYTKTTKDALVAVPLPPSNGEVQTQFRNLARIRNKGLELAISAAPISTPNFSLDFTLSGSITNNKVLSLGDSVAPISFGFYQQDRAGYTAGGFWGLPLLGFNDANHDGIIDQSEVRVGDTLVYQGSPLPTREAALNIGMNFFHDRIRLAGQWDYRGGNTVDNSMENFRCSAVFNCRGEFDKTASLEEQAKAQAVLLSGGNAFGYFEPGWFIKLREVSLTFYGTPGMARALGASSISLTLAARNLLTITDYTGVDPEVNAFGQDGFAVSDFESQPQVRYLIARVNASF